MKNKYKKLDSKQRVFVKSPSWGGSLSWVYLLFSGATLEGICVFLASLFPVINIIAFVYVIIRGRQTIWEKANWDSFSEFKESQTKWDKGAKIYWLTSLFVFITVLLVFVSLPVYLNTKNESNQTISGISLPSKIYSVGETVKVQNISVSLIGAEKINESAANEFQTEACLDPVSYKKKWAKFPELLSATENCTVESNYNMYQISFNVTNNSNEVYSYPTGSMKAHGLSLGIEGVSDSLSYNNKYSDYLTGRDMDNSESWWRHIQPHKSETVKVAIKVSKYKDSGVLVMTFHRFSPFNNNQETKFNVNFPDNN